jgi:hypothetical protein
MTPDTWRAGFADGLVVGFIAGMYTIVAGIVLVAWIERRRRQHANHTHRTNA